MKLGKPLAERKKLIRQLLSQEEKKNNTLTYPLHFKSDTYDLTVISVPIGVLKYRVENKRNNWQIKEYEKKNDLDFIV